MVLRDQEEEVERAAWGLAGSPLSGRLPGVYQNVRIIILLVPYQSM